MKRIALILFALATVNFMLAQERSIKLGLEMSYDQLEDAPYLPSINSYYAKDRDVVNYTLGLSALFDTNSFISFGAGLLYQKKDFKRFITCINCLSILPFEAETVRQRYLAVPLQMRLKASDKKIQPSFELGMIHHFTISSQTENLNTPHFLEAQLALGVLYQLSPQLSLELAYQFKNAITDIYNDEVIRPRQTDDFDTNEMRTRGFRLRIWMDL